MAEFWARLQALLADIFLGYREDDDQPHQFNRLQYGVWALSAVALLLTLHSCALGG